MPVQAFDIFEGTPTIDFAKAHADGFGLCIAKATEGATYHDTKFAEHYAAIHAAGMVRGSYNFARPKTSTAEEEVTAYVEAVNAAGGFDGAFPPTLDLEDRETGFSPSQMQAWAREWATLAKEKTGRRPVLYADSSFIKEYGLDALHDVFDLWVAAYDVKSPDIAGFPSYVMWQTSNKGTVAGTSPCDVDVFTADLTAYVGGTEHAAATVAAVVALSTARVHVVQEGETLSGISLMYHVPVAVLSRFNGLSNPNQILAGEKILIPSYVRVQPGDTVSALAKKYGTTVETIAHTNSINPDYIQVGEWLFV